jgi:hypothetical protein
MRSFPAILLVLLASADPAMAGEPEAARVRVWAATRLEIAGHETTDEAGARWLEAQGRLVTDRGEGVAGVELRFERGVELERAATAGDGSFRVLLRAGGAPWTARFDGGERLRPASAAVPASPPAPTERSWLVFVPLLALALALAAGGGVLLVRRLPGLFARLLAAWRRSGAVRGSGMPGGRGWRPEDARARRLRVIDALRFRPIAGARLESVPPAAAVLAVTDDDGTIELSAAPAAAVVRSPGYLGRSLGAKPAATTTEGPDAEDELVPLLRGRDAVVGWLERSLSATPSTGLPETVGRLASRAGPPEDAAGLAAICYGRPRPPDEEARALLRRLHARAAALAAGDEQHQAPEPAAVVDALATEPGAAACATSAPRG